MTGVADPALDLARYVSAISGGDPNSVGKMPDQKVLDMALANLDKIFGQGPEKAADAEGCLLYTSPSPRDATLSRMPSSA